MLKLMKYEFRKMRTMLIILLVILAALEGGFIYGIAAEYENAKFACLSLLIILAVVTYIYILISGIVSYSRELKDRTGYLTFMAPVRPISIVTSKLLTTVLAAAGFGLLFGACAAVDFRYIMEFMGIDRTDWAELSIAFRVAFAEEGITLTELALTAGYTVLEMLIEMVSLICTAYLSITLSATVLQNRKGFLRVLVGFLLFWLVSGGMNEVSSRFFLPDRAVDMPGFIRLMSLSLLFHTAASGIFAVISAALLKRKVSL